MNKTILKSGLTRKLYQLRIKTKIVIYYIFKYLKYFFEYKKFVLIKIDALKIVFYSS